MAEARGFQSFGNIYRERHNLLSTKQIIWIRKKSGLTQKEFSEILGWEKYYENGSLQSIEHEKELRKIEKAGLENYRSACNIQ